MIYSTWQICILKGQTQRMIRMMRYCHGGICVNVVRLNSSTTLDNAVGLHPKILRFVPAKPCQCSHLWTHRFYSILIATVWHMMYLNNFAPCCHRMPQGSRRLHRARRTKHLPYPVNRTIKIHQFHLYWDLVTDISYIARVMTAFCVWKVIDIGEDTIKIIKSALAAIAHSQHMIHSHPFSMFLWSSHAPGFPKNPSNHQRPALVGSHFFWHPSTWHRTLVQNSMHLADLRRMMRILADLLRQKSRQNARKNLNLLHFLAARGPLLLAVRTSETSLQQGPLSEHLRGNFWGADWSPDCPSSRVLWNISIPAMVAFIGLSCPKLLEPTVWPGEQGM